MLEKLRNVPPNNNFYGKGPLNLKIILTNEYPKYTQNRYFGKKIQRLNINPKSFVEVDENLPVDGGGGNEDVPGAEQGVGQGLHGRRGPRHDA